MHRSRRHRRCAAACVAFAFTLGVVCPARAAGTPERRVLSAAQTKSLQRRIAGYVERVAAGKASRATAGALEKIVQQAPFPLAAEAAAALAHYHRSRNELETALEVLAPWVPPKAGPAHLHPKASLEQVRCLHAQGKLTEALPILQWIAEQCPDTTQIEAAKFAGDLCAELLQFERAISFYEWALKLVALHFPYPDPGGADKRRREQLMALIAETKRRWDVERYGADFVAYRDADRLRFAGKPAQALDKYAEVIAQYPGTAYSEAATVYSGYCCRDLEEYAKAEELWRDMLENPWGLYRGEICLALANMEFEYRLRPEKAEYWYRKAIEWMDKVKLVDSRVSAFTVPGQALAVSAPPAAMKEQKAWIGPPDWAQVKPGTVINRRTCRWYLNKLRLDAHGKLALILFLAGNAKAAQDEIGAILKYDEYEKSLHTQQRPNSYTRLHYEFGIGCLRADEEEFAAFTGRARTMVAIGDYYYEVEDWKAARNIYDKMARLHGTGKPHLSRNAEAYVVHMQGMCRQMLHEWDSAMTYFRRFREGGEFRGTPSWPKAMFGQKHILMQTQGRDEAIEILKEIMRYAKGTDSERRALLHMGEMLYWGRRYAESAKVFESYVKRYPDKALSAPAYLNDIYRDTNGKYGQPTTEESGE
ncbi:MAG: tetratricopeptide repeat protein [Kiritimatiellae bacterium]|nr:tetratricopeptide repeat protein [Kiritimatiellia bacterium]